MRIYFAPFFRKKTISQTICSLINVNDVKICFKISSSLLQIIFSSKATL